MATVVGSVTLDNDMLWTDQYAYSKLSVNVDRALSGREIIQIAEIPSGTPITLQSGSDYGWQSRAVVKALVALSQTYSTFNLQISGQTIAVRFRHEEGTPVSFEPVSLFQPQNDTVEYWYSGSVLLATV